MKKMSANHTAPVLNKDTEFHLTKNDVSQRSTFASFGHCVVLLRWNSFAYWIVLEKYVYENKKKSSRRTFFFNVWDVNL